MSSTDAFVPIETWLYHSPGLLRSGRLIDIGLIAEAMIFYERIYVGVTSDVQFAKVVTWFHSQGKTADLIALLKDRVVVPYYYAFHTMPASKDNIWTLMNVQDEEAARIAVFCQRILRSGTLASLVRKRSQFEALARAAEDSHIEVKAESFGPAIENARKDYADGERAAYLVQLAYDELYKDLGYLEPPAVRAVFKETGDIQEITWNVDFTEFARKLGKNATFHSGTPLAAAGFGAKTLWSAAELRADLYIGSPMLGYAEYKLAEGNKAARAKAVMNELVARVSFPDIRDLVNHGQIGVEEVLRLRRKASRFRQWLRAESMFDRDAVIAYLGEIADDAGWKKGLGKTVQAVGIFGGAAAGAALAGPIGAAGGAVAGKLIEYVVGLGAMVDSGWRPKVFGQAARKTIEEAIRRRA